MKPNPSKGKASTPKSTPDDYLQALREKVEQKGLKLGDGWTCILQPRGDPKARADPYYFDSNGRRCRSVLEVIRLLNGESPKSKQPKAAKPGKASASGSEKLNHLLSREDAAKDAKQALGDLALPAVLPDAGVTLTSIGEFDMRQSYRSQQHIFPVGLTTEFQEAAGTFVSQIRDGGDEGPLFSVSLKAASEGEAQEIASAKSANKVWEKVAEIQEKQATSQDEKQQDPEQANRSSDGPVSETKGTGKDKAAAQSNLCEPDLGLKRFGLMSETVLKAIEGLDGLAECKDYKYVQQVRLWQTHMSNLNKAAKPQIKQLPISPVKRRSAAGKKLPTVSTGAGQQKITAFMDGKPVVKQPASGPKRKREGGDGAARTGGSGSAVKHFKGAEDSVQAVVEKMLNQVEKKYGAAKKRESEKASRTRQKAVEKERQKREKEAAEEAERQRRFAEAEARRKAAAAGPPDDSKLPGAEIKPPAPTPLPGAQHLPAYILPGVLEMWELLGRFSSLFSMAEVPSLAELAQAISKPAPDSRDAFNVSMAALTAAVASEAFEAAVIVASDTNEDINKRDTRAAEPDVQGATWAETARRLFALAAVGNLVRSHPDGLSGGLDVALGLHVGCSPMALLGPGIIFQGLAAGGLPSNAFATSAALPVGACASASSARTARLDAQALIAAEHHLATAFTGSSTPHLDAKTITMCRRLLQHIKGVKGRKDTDGLVSRSSILFFEGEKAAIAAKIGHPLDLHTIAVRNDTGLYASMLDGITVFSSDVNYVCRLFDAAAHNKKSEFGHTLQCKRTPEIAEEVRKRLKALLPAALDGSLQSPAGAKQPSSVPPSREASVSAEEAHGRQPLDVHDTFDLARPLSMVEGCCVCWGDSDRGKILICDGCEEEYHVYCLDPPLTQLPGTDDEWFCPPCEAREEGRSPVPLYQQPYGQHHGFRYDDEYARAATLLGSKEVSEMSVEERVKVTELMASLTEYSNSLRDHLNDDETQKKDLRKEMIELRAKIKRDDKEREEKQKEERERLKNSGAPAQEASLARPRTRAEEAAEAEAIADRTRIEELTKQLRVQANGVRREPIGYDRHWNRYWVLGSFDPSEAGLLCMEQTAGKLYKNAESGDERLKQILKVLPEEFAEAKEPATSTSAGKFPEWGCYPDEAAVDKLIGYLNSKGAREGPLLKEVRKHRDLLRQPSPPREKDAAAEKGHVDHSALQLANGTAGLHAGNDLDMPNADAAMGPFSAPPQEAEAQEGEPLQVVCTAETAEANGDMQAAGTGHEEEVRSDEEAEPSGLAKLQSELLALIDNLDVESLDSARTSVQRLTQWRTLADKASSPQDLMAAIVLAEGFLPVERLKPWWRLWAYPAPNFSMHGALAGPIIRLKALKSAMKKGPMLPQRTGFAVASDSGDGTLRGSRYPSRANRAAAGALAESALFKGALRGSVNNSEDDSDADNEALAKALNNQLNPGQRELRKRLRDNGQRIYQESNGSKPTRAAARMQTSLQAAHGQQPRSKSHFSMEADDGTDSRLPSTDPDSEFEGAASMEQQDLDGTAEGSRKVDITGCKRLQKSAA